LGASGVVSEQVVPARVKAVESTVIASCVICSGPVPVFVIVTTLVTGARGVGVVKVRCGIPKSLDRVPFVADVKLSVPEGASTVKVTPLLVPPGVVTVTVVAPGIALDEMKNVVEICVPVASTVSRPILISLLDTFTLAPARFVPVRVTGTTSGVNPDLSGAGAVPVAGAIPTSVGGAGLAPEANSTAPGSKRLSPAGRASGLALPKKSVGG